MNPIGYKSYKSQVFMFLLMVSTIAVTVIWFILFGFSEIVYTLIFFFTVLFSFCFALNRFLKYFRTPLVLISHDKEKLYFNGKKRVDSVLLADVIYIYVVIHSKVYSFFFANYGTIIVQTNNIRYRIRRITNPSLTVKNIVFVLKQSGNEKCEYDVMRDIATLPYRQL